jgi:predicted dehydrogenase
MAVEGKSETTMRRRLRLGMVGGGPGAFIGGVHRIASRLDGHYELVAGAIASDPARAKAGAALVGIAPDRAYGNFEEMVAGEKTRSDRIDAVAIVTPNFAHHAAAKAFLNAGFHVICDKPVTTSFATALDLAETVKTTGMILGLTHNYTGYPMVRQAREMVAVGEVGKVRVVQVEYAQDWLTTPLELTGQKQVTRLRDEA